MALYKCCIIIIIIIIISRAIVSTALYKSMRITTIIISFLLVFSEIGLITFNRAK